MNYSRSLTLCVLLLLANAASAQHQEVDESPKTWTKTSNNDSTSILSVFKRGTMHGHFRNFFMATINRDKLTDYHSNAIGGGLKYETGKFHGFQFGVSGYYIMQAFGSDLTKIDTLANSENRYEIGLYDINVPQEKGIIDRLEELYLKYENGRVAAVYGKMLLNTPFINLQDGRMRPTESEGLDLKVNISKKVDARGIVLYGISPRSTSKYFGIGESMGLYKSGLNTLGKPSNYAGNIEANTIVIANVNYAPSATLKLQWWNQYVDKVFNTMMLQANSKHNQWELGVQAIYQHAIKDGGNADQTKTYMDKGAQSLTIGAMAQYKYRKWMTNLAYTHITDKGRYLMPREWGRDPFFTFMPRERNEGMANVHAVVLKTNYQWNKRWQTSMAIGHFNLPDVKKVAQNKYGMPSYAQINLDLRYQFTGFLQGFDLQCLVAHKIGTGNDYDQPKYVFNKVDMTNVNVVVNFRF